MNIVIIGNVCIDRNVSENVSYTAPGSPSMYLSKIFNQLPGTTTTIISSYGNDFLPYTHDISIYPLSPNKKHTLVYENITKNKHRTQKALFYEMANPIPLDTELATLLRDADILYLAPITPNFSPKYIESIIREISIDCIVILSPQGYFRKFDDHNNVLFREFVEAEKIVPFVQFVITSEQDHPEMKKIAKNWAKNFNTTVIVTIGEKGADIFTKEQTFSISTDPVSEKDIVDSVGSGDIFSAGFGFFYHKTHDIQQSVKFANALARQCLFFTPDAINIDYKKLSEINDEKI